MSKPTRGHAPSRLPRPASKAARVRWSTFWICADQGQPGGLHVGGMLGSFGRGLPDDPGGVLVRVGGVLVVAGHAQYTAGWAWIPEILGFKVNHYQALHFLAGVPAGRFELPACAPHRNAAGSRFPFGTPP